MVDSDYNSNIKEFAGGNGTEYAPYLISNKTHLNNVRNHLDAYFKIICNIEFDDADFEKGGKFRSGFLKTGRNRA